jgi:hypothetical protein
MGAPKKAIFSLLTLGLSSNRLSSLLMLCCSCAVFAVRGFHCFVSFSCCACAAIATASRASSFSDFICASVGGLFPGRFETHRIHLLVFALLVWTRAYVVTRSLERDEHMKTNFRYRRQWAHKIRDCIVDHLKLATHTCSSRVRCFAFRVVAV